MKPAPFKFLMAESEEEAVAALDAHGDECKVLAGGQSLVPLLNMRLARPSVLVDVSRAVELGRCEDEGAYVRFGAAVTHASIEDRAVPDATAGLMSAAAAGIGYRAVRNRGTIGGSLAHADASAEWPVVLAALGATVRAVSSGGSRQLPARAFVTGFFSSALGASELVSAIDVPRLPECASWGLVKFSRKAGEFAESLAVAIVFWSDGRPTSADVWLGAAREVPLAVSVSAGAFADIGVSVAASPQVEAAVTDAVREVLDTPTTDEDRYLLHLHSVTVARAIDRALHQGREHGFTG